MRLAIAFVVCVAAAGAAAVSPLAAPTRDQGVDAPAVAAATPPERGAELIGLRAQIRWDAITADTQGNCTDGSRHPVMTTRGAPVRVLSMTPSARGWTLRPRADYSQLEWGLAADLGRVDRIAWLQSSFQLVSPSGQQLSALFRTPLKCASAGPAAFEQSPIGPAHPVSVYTGLTAACGFVATSINGGTVTQEFLVTDGAPANLPALSLSAFKCDHGKFSTQHAPLPGPEDSCVPYVVIDSRGSGGRPGTTSPPGAAFVKAFRAVHPTQTVTVIGNPYAAPGALSFAGLLLKLPAGYHQSVAEGTAWLKARINQLANSCPRAKLFLTGYSQGAQVTADAVQRGGWRSQIKGVAVFGDPYFNSQDGLVARESGGFRVGRNGWLGKRRYFADAIGHGPASVVRSYCHDGDPVCQGPRAAPNLFRRHHYEAEGARAGGAFARRN